MIRQLWANGRFLPPPEVEMIFFDKGGTLSKPVTGREDGGIPNFKKIMELIGVDEDPAVFGARLVKNDKAYKKWALDSWVELNEEERCSRFLLPDYPPERVKPHAIEITLLFSRSKGVRELRTEALPVIRELHNRGYRMGIISNTVSTVLVPRELDDAGITPYIETLIMSSITGIRKPDPRMFSDATKSTGTLAAKSAYIGDQPNRDVEGPRRAGYGLNVILKTSNYPEEKDLPELQTPDIVIDTLEDLFELFPPKAGRK